MQNLLGTYAIEGINPDQEGSTYQGVLVLTSDDNETISAKWIIGGSQEQYGKGYIQDGKLCIDFHYYDEFSIQCNGQVIYTFTDYNVLKGIWVEENGEEDCVGQENGFRIEKTLYC